MTPADALDSRALRYTDCYGQRFMRRGTFRYHVLPLGGHSVSDERPYAIEVVERTSAGSMTQHTVSLAATRGAFRPEPASLRVEVGDLVLWNCPDRKAPGFAVVGEANREFFGSARLSNECGYSHAFGLAGEYAWADANGSGLSGVVRVRDPRCQTEADVERWRRELTKGALVVIADGKAEPAKVDVVVGQTVFFAIVKAPGITITDRRLLDITGQWPRLARASRDA